MRPQNQGEDRAMGVATTSRAAEVWHVDSFAQTRFSGNPAAVVLFDTAPDNDVVEALGREFNLPATAVLWPISRSPAEEEAGARFRLRWQTPTAELALCGHGTLAAAHVLYAYERVPENEPITFETIAGSLSAHRIRDQVTLEFPALEPHPVTPPAQLTDVLTESTSHSVRSVHRTELDLLVELDDEEAVIRAKPDLQQLLRIDVRGLILTAKSDLCADHDFTSRFFSPATGIPEDSVTGSAHCALAPFWLKLLRADRLLGYQASRRGGYVQVAINERGRVELSGTAIAVTHGALTLG